MPRQRQTRTQIHKHSIASAPVFVCPVDSCPGRIRFLIGKRAWARHRRTYHANIDFTQYENAMRTHTPASDAEALSPSPMSSPSSSLTTILEDDPFIVEDDTVDRLPIDDFLLSDPPTYQVEQSQPDADSQLEPDADDGDSQSDGSFKIHYHPVLDGMPLFFMIISIDPY